MGQDRKIGIAMFEAARAICSELNGGPCKCRDNAGIGTCSDKLTAAALGVATFLAHPGLRESKDAKQNETCPKLAFKISERFLR